MTNNRFIVTGFAGGATLLSVLTGCVADGPSPRSGYRGPPAVQVRAVVAFQDDYDYYPAYETYYSRNRHEYVYRDGNTWVRRATPPGVAVNVLAAASVVRLDFHDSPEQHHTSVIQTYPRNWAPPGKAKDNKDDRKDDKKKHGKGNDKGDDDRN